MAIKAPVVEQQDCAALTEWYALFLQQFPEFSDAAAYPAGNVQTWIIAGAEQIDQCRYGNQYNLAVCLFIAHNVVLAAHDAKSGGGAAGPVVSKTIDKLSVSYGTTTAIEGAGIYNLTSYGQRLYKMMQTFNSGPVYIPRPRHRR